ncbi:hypothetical protein PIB30_020472 [Stylosanthes scabra]|uniref:Uncharacterized protein n=1 Tax=Stylosanthes scabra TaxID=79078 RepID=A0ABU6VA45_9FABA|nr:hypothetical protein [Stylosanthes scabra]
METGTLQEIHQISAVSPCFSLGGYPRPGRPRLIPYVVSSAPSFLHTFRPKVRTRD